MWDCPRTGIEPTFPALASGFSSTVPLGKSPPGTSNIQILLACALVYGSPLPLGREAPGGVGSSLSCPPRVPSTENSVWHTGDAQPKMHREDRGGPGKGGPPVSQALASLPPCPRPWDAEVSKAWLR